MQRLPKLALAFRNPIRVFELRVLEFLVQYFSYFISIICWIMFKDVYNDNLGEATTIPNTPVEPSRCILLSVVSSGFNFCIFFGYLFQQIFVVLDRYNFANECGCNVYARIQVSKFEDSDGIPDA